MKGVDGGKVEGGDEQYLNLKFRPQARRHRRRRKVITKLLRMEKECGSFVNRMSGLYMCVLWLPNEMTESDTHAGRIEINKCGRTEWVAAWQGAWRMGS